MKLFTKLTKEDWLNAKNAILEAPETWKRSHLIQEKAQEMEAAINEYLIPFFDKKIKETKAKK